MPPTIVWNYNFKLNCCEKKKKEGTSCRENLPVASTNFSRLRETNQAVTSSRNLWCSKRILLCTLILKTLQWQHKDSCRTIHFPGPHPHISTYNCWQDKSSEDLGKALAQPLSSHSLVAKSVNCLKYNLIAWLTDSLTVQTSVGQILLNLFKLSFLSFKIRMVIVPITLGYWQN